MFRAGIGWQYRGVVHEYPHAPAATTSARLIGDYHIESGRRGARSLDPDRYRRDAEILERALLDEPRNERSWFYLGQSYFDAGNYAESRRAYAQRATMGGWGEEVFYSLLRVGQCEQALEAPDEPIIAAFLRAYEARPTRAEPLYHLARHFRIRGRHDAAYIFARRAAAIAYPEADGLFINADVYRFGALDELGLAAYYSGRVGEARQVWATLLAGELSPGDRERIERNLGRCADSSPARGEEGAR